MSTFPTIDPVATGARIKELRLEKQLSVRDISYYMGFEEPQAVYKWQRGESLPTIDNLYALSKLFGTSMDNIIRGREEDKRSSSFHVNQKLLNYEFNDKGVTMIYDKCNLYKKVGRHNEDDKCICKQNLKTA